MSEHWIQKLAVRNGELLLKFLTQAESRAAREVEILEKVFSDHDVMFGDTVLDLCCGYGRHALRLAKKGYRVTGLDLSPVLILEAQKRAQEMGVDGRTTFLVGDARHLVQTIKPNATESFRAVVNMWGSLGYYDDETDRDILTQCHGLASQRGVLIMEVGNRDYLVKHPVPCETSRFEDIELHAYPRLDVESSRLKQVWKFYRVEGTGEDLKHILSVDLDMRSYSLHELVRLVESAGWRYVNSYGTLDMKPVSPDVNRILIVAEKKSSGSSA